MKKHNLFKFYACIGIATLIAGLNLKHAANDYGVSTNAKLALQIIAQATTTNGNNSTSNSGSSSGSSGWLWKSQKTEDTCTVTRTEGSIEIGIGIVYKLPSQSSTFNGKTKKCVDGWWFCVTECEI